MSGTHAHANPGCLGLLGFGMTTILLNIHNAGITELSTMIVAMGLCLGGLCQIIAGIMEFKANNTFGATAFTAYGAFWWSLVLIWCLPAEKLGVEAASHTSMGFYLLLWAIFTGFMFIGTLKATKMHRVVFATLTLLFLLLALENFLVSHPLAIAAGVVGIICGAAAFYGAVAQVINEMFGKTVLPI